MSKTTIINTIDRTTNYSNIFIDASAKYNCGTLQLILNNDWTQQMIHELPAINISIYTTDDSKYLSFNIIMSTISEELKKLSPSEPYSIPIYNLPQYFKFVTVPLFDENALVSYNSAIKDGNIEIFNTTNNGIVDTNVSDYSSELWTTKTDNFDITILFDDSNVSSGGGGGGSSSVDAEDVTYDNTSSGLNAVNVQDAIDEIDTRINNLPEPMIFKGSLGTGGTITTLPDASQENKGYTYKVITAGTYQSIDAEVGDTFISDGTSWVLIPSGDEPGGTVTNVGISSTDGTVKITGSPITSSGTINLSSVGKNVEGTEYTVGGQTVTAGTGAEIFNKYTNNKAVGEYSHAEGSGTQATGAYSHTEGGGTNATGTSSHAEGGSSTASGGFSHAEGAGTLASGSYSHAEGAGTSARGLASHSEGEQTNANGSNSHAEGHSTTANGDQSHAEGHSTTASGSLSHAEGDVTVASGSVSHAEGLGTIAASAYQHAQGQYNVEDSNNQFAFIIGNGTGANARHNAFAIDWSGNIYVNGSSTGISVSVLSSILTPISQSEYDALVTKDKPLYFIYDDTITANSLSLNSPAVANLHSLNMLGVDGMSTPQVNSIMHNDDEFEADNAQDIDNNDDIIDEGISSLSEERSDDDMNDSLFETE